MEKVENLEELVVEGENGFSECSSGCQSGWTMYLCQSQDDSPTSSSPPPIKEVISTHQDDEEEDLSMLSDASSGPPHLVEEDCINFHYCSRSDGDGCLTTFAKRRKVGEEQRQKQIRKHEQYSSLLDDTATSPLFSFSKAASSISSSCSSNKHIGEDVLELSCGFSANHFKRKTALKNHNMGYLHSSAPLNQAPGCRQEDESNPL